MSLKSDIILYFHNKKWRMNNKGNYTTAANLFNISQVSVGKGTYGPLYVLTHGNDAKLEIGSYCSIGPQVAFVVQSDHPLNHLTTYPFKVMNGLAQYEAISKGNIVVEDDVWIGLRAIILSGVHIGRGAVIGAGSVITHDIPPYAIVTGVPGRVVGTRFSEEVVTELSQIDLSKIKSLETSKMIEVLNHQIKDCDDIKMIKNTLL